MIFKCGCWFLYYVLFIAGMMISLSGADIDAGITPKSWRSVAGLLQQDERAPSLPEIPEMAGINFINHENMDG